MFPVESETLKNLYKHHLPKRNNSKPLIVPVLVPIINRPTILFLASDLGLQGSNRCFKPFVFKWIFQNDVIFRLQLTAKITRFFSNVLWGVTSKSGEVPFFDSSKSRVIFTISTWVFICYSTCSVTGARVLWIILLDKHGTRRFEDYLMCSLSKSWGKNLFEGINVLTKFGKKLC